MKTHKNIFLRALAISSVMLLTALSSAHAVTMNYTGLWLATTTYPAGAVVVLNKQTYYALAGNNKNMTPATRPGWWQPIGTVGNTLASGAGGPASTVGNVSDFYIDTKNKRIYGPKAASGWPATFVSMVGIQGATGAQGIQGLTGATGAQGAQGSIGFTGAQGPIGLTGAAGANGDTGAQGIQGLKGNTGITGAIGAKGDTGVAGTNGAIGPKGADGAQGVKGDTGLTGLTGAIGAKGDMGLTGAIGPKGDIGVTGATGPKGDIGVTGATGPKGDIGVTGATGPKGDIGLTGPTGAIGTKGATGLTGLTGAIGPKGDTGLIGLTGATGAKGDLGLTGAIGPKGDIGLTGPTGAIGPKGDIGVTGAIGPKGDTGLIGPTGAKGDMGLTGAIGPKGDTGPAGSFPSATTKGDMQYWDGTAWVMIPVGAHNTTLKNCNGRPTWVVVDCPDFIIGDKGPVGGIVFYTTVDGKHGLEAAPVDQGPVPWGCLGTTIGGTSTEVGTGRANTARIVTVCNEAETAAKAADAYSLNGYDDWYLPSSGELWLLYSKMSGFANSDYWSSSEYMDNWTIKNYAWYVNFGNGFISKNHSKNQSLPMRAIRAF